VPTPLEGQILDDFEERLTASDAIPDGLVQKLMAFARSDRVPAADALLETIKANVGDQSV
jgi:uncharacterized protein (DUF2342 family)